MPRFFFNHTSHDTVSVDDIGAEFETLEAAYLNTCDAILDIAFEKLRERQDPTEDAFEIVGEYGDMLVCIPFSEVLRPRRRDDRPIVRTNPLLARSDQLRARHQELKADLKNEFSRTTSELQAVHANMARLGTACFDPWLQPKQA
jgi:hypothetical protein